MDYTIWIDNKPIPVSEEIYHTYWKGIRKERYFAESDIHNKVFSYNALDTEEMNGSDIFSDYTSLPLEEQVIQHLENQTLQRALQHLEKHERELITKIYVYNHSLRMIARSENIPVTTLQYRHKKILLKLKNYLLQQENYTH